MIDHRTKASSQSIAARAAGFALPLLMASGLLAQTAQGTGLAQAQVAAEREQPMAKDANPGFLVATIKPSDPG
jgi:hypothetical protein